MPQVKREWFCAPYVGWHLCRLRLHLWSPLHSSGTFLAPLVYVLMPWRTNECYLKAYSLIDFAITLPDGVDVDRLRGGHERCLDRAWPHSSCSLFRGARGFPTLEQLHSSVVIAKDTSSVTMFDSVLPGALESASADEPPALAPARGRGARGGRMRRAGGARGRCYLAEC